MKKSRKGINEHHKISRLPLLLFIWATIVIIVIPLFSILILHLPVVQSEVIKKLVQQIETRTLLKVELKSYRWLPFAGLNLKKLKVFSSGKEIVQCEEAKLSYSLSLKWPYVLPKELYLEKPVLHLEKDREGHWQLPKKNSQKDEISALTSSRSKPSAPEADLSTLLLFPWPHIRIASGVVMAEQNGHQILTIRDMTGTLTLQLVSGPEGPSLRVHLGQWKGEADVPHLGKWELSGEAELQEDLFSIGSATLFLDEKTKLTCKGKLAILAPYDIDLECELNPLAAASIPELHARMPQLKELFGPVHISRQAGVWSVDHELRSDSGEIKGNLRAERNAEDKLLIHWNTRFSELLFPAVKEMHVPGAILSGRLQMSFQGGEPDDMKGQAKILLEQSSLGEYSIHKGEIAGSYERGILTVNGSSIQTTLGDFSLSSSVDLKGLWDPGHHGEIKGDLRAQRAKIDKVVSGMRSHQQAGGVFHLEATYGPGHIRNFQLWNAKVDADINVPDLASVKASGTYKDEMINADYIFQTGDAAKFGNIYPEWQGKGQVVSKGNIKGRWPDLLWEGEISSPRFQYDQLQGEQIAINGKGKLTGKEE